MVLVTMFRVVLIAVISATAAGGGDDIESSWHVGVNHAFMIFDSCFGSFTSSNVWETKLLSPEDPA